jgi:hypothetical protein
LSTYSEADDPCYDCNDNCDKCPIDRLRQIEQEQ